MESFGRLRSKLDFSRPFMRQPVGVQLPALRNALSRLWPSRFPRVQYTRFNACAAALLVSLFICPTTALAEPADVLSVARKAIEKLDATNLDDDWYFTMELVEDDETQVIQSNPRAGKYEKRALITVNGKAADSERQATFRESEVSRIDALEPDTSGYSYLINAASLQLIHSGDGVAELSFQPRVQAMESAQDQLRGQLVLNLQTQQIEEIEITNTQKLSPAFSVTVDTYRLALTFQPEQGEVLLAALDSQATGTAGFLKSFDKVVYVTFRDYQPASP